MGIAGLSGVEAVGGGGGGGVAIVVLEDELVPPQAVRVRLVAQRPSLMLWMSLTNI